MPLTITPSGGSATTFQDPFDGFIRTVGNYYIQAGLAHDPNYAIETNSAPAADGYNVSRHGFRGRDIDQIEVIYINTTPDLCNAAYATDQAAIKNSSCSVVIPNDATYPSCEIVHFRKKGRPKDMGNGKYRLHAMLEIKQMRLV